ncbi:TetR/AcrR family transcriptional regulator [bacterium]|nr:TetR/AcrR family transcriptional regulator [bacterium]
MGVKERKAREFQRRELEILETAYLLLTEMEPGKMTMEMIAKEAEIGRGTIYKHFKSKDEIYANLILNRRKKYIQKLKEIKKDTDGVQCEQKLIRSYMEYCLDDPVAFKVHKRCINHCVRDNLGPELIDALNAQQEEKIKLVEEILRDNFNESPEKLDDLIYYIGAGWGMQRGAIDALLEDRIEGSILEKEKYFRIVEQILIAAFGRGKL